MTHEILTLNRKHARIARFEFQLEPEELETLSENESNPSNESALEDGHWEQGLDDQLVKQLISAPLQADKNFARSELLKLLYDYTSSQTNRDTNAFAQFEKRLSSAAREAEKRGYPLFGGGTGGWRTAIWPDPLRMLGQPSKTNHAGALPTTEEAYQVLRDIFQQSTGPILDKLQKEAQARPDCNFDLPCDTENPFSLLLPHLAKLKALEQQAATRAMVGLHFKRIPEAFNDAQLGLFLSDSVKSEPLLISLLVRIAAREIAIAPIWFGLATHQWDAHQLQQFQQQFEAVDMPAEMRHAMKGELLLANRFIETFRRKFPREMNFKALGTPKDQSNEGESSWDLELFLNYCYPKGWLCFEQLNYLQYFRKWILDPMSQDQPKSKPTEAVVWSELEGSELKRIFRHTLLAGMLLPALDTAQSKAIRSQTAQDMAGTACALERFRLDKGQYPEKLAELVPRYKNQLAKDLFTGESLIYRRNADGSFILYSVGQNGVDDGGVVSIGKSGNVRYEEGDWVWKYPDANQAGNPL